MIIYFIFTITLIFPFTIAFVLTSVQIVQLSLGLPISNKGWALPLCRNQVARVSEDKLEFDFFLFIPSEVIVKEFFQSNVTT